METVNHKERAHSELGASSASRWLACPSSVSLSEGIEEKESNFASEGTCAHEVADITLSTGGHTEDLIGNVYEGHTVTKEMSDYVDTYVQYVREAGKGKEMSIEERIDLSFIDPRMFGSNDAIIYEPYGTLEIIDLKYGMGIEVSPENNKQLMYYALGAAQGGEYSHVKMTIVQPRVSNPIKSWTVPYSVIEAYAEELKQGVEKVDSGEDYFSIGDHCRFCKAKAICPATKAKTQELARLDFADHMPVKKESFPNPSDLSNIEISRVLEHSKAIQEWLKSVSVYALNQLEVGRKIDGYKLVAGRSVRVLTNPKEFEAEFGAIYGDAIYAPKKLIGIGDLEKLVGKKGAAPFLSKPEASNTIAPVSDKRKEVLPRIKEDFKEFINQPEAEDSFLTMEF